VRELASVAARPSAELVKIDPKSIVGQYQHDVDQKLLKKKLDETVESCVNYVGVDLNTASKELLALFRHYSHRCQNNYLSAERHGAPPLTAKGAKVSSKAFEHQWTLRIRGGENPLVQPFIQRVTAYRC